MLASKKAISVSYTHLDVYKRQGVGSPSARPTPEMAYQACLDAEKNQPAFGNAGAGTGASVGKLLGMEYAMKSGLGAYAVEVGPLQVGALEMCIRDSA